MSKSPWQEEEEEVEVKYKSRLFRDVLTSASGLGVVGLIAIGRQLIKNSREHARFHDGSIGQVLHKKGSSRKNYQH